VSNVKTTSQLREFLLETMEGVKNGKLAYEKASVIIKGASQVNESIYAELKAKSLAKDMGDKRYDLGKLPIAD